jgi:hypothetical protein
MAERRTPNPADLVKYYTDLISAERIKLEDCLAAISEYAEQLKKVADDTGRRLIGRS